MSALCNHPNRSLYLGSPLPVRSRPAPSMRSPLRSRAHSTPPSLSLSPAAVVTAGVGKGDGEILHHAWQGRHRHLRRLGELFPIATLLISSAVSAWSSCHDGSGGRCLSLCCVGLLLVRCGAGLDILFEIKVCCGALGGWGVGWGCRRYLFKSLLFPAPCAAVGTDAHRSCQPSAFPSSSLLHNPTLLPPFPFHPIVIALITAAGTIFTMFVVRISALTSYRRKYSWRISWKEQEEEKCVY